MLDNIHPNMPAIDKYRSVTHPNEFLVDWPSFYRQAYIRGQALRGKSDYEAGIQYGPDPDQLMNIFYTKNEDKNNPIFVFIHGGGFSEGHPDFYDFIGQNFLKAGITFASVGYRVSPTRFPDSAFDIADALSSLDKRLRSRGRLQPNYILSGHSAGASIAALVGVRGDILDAAGLSPIVIKGLVLISGIYDFTSSDPSQHFVDRERHHEASAINYLNNVLPPIIIVNGDPEFNRACNSPQIFKVRASNFETELRRNHHKVLRLELKGADHIKTACALENHEIFNAVINMFTGS